MLVYEGEEGTITSYAQKGINNINTQINIHPNQIYKPINSLAGKVGTLPAAVIGVKGSSSCSKL